MQSLEGKEKEYYRNITGYTSPNWANTYFQIQTAAAKSRVTAIWSPSWEGSRAVHPPHG